MEVRVRFRLLAVIPVLLISVLPSIALAKTATDPNDLSYNIDFKAVSLVRPFGSKLSWSFTSWDRFKGTDMLGGANPTLNLDSRSGTAIDYNVIVGWSPTSGYYCQLKKA